MSSLQEQLLKAGLTTKQKTRQANSDRRRKNKQKRSGASVETTLQEQVQQDLAKQQAQKQEKDKALNEQKKRELAQKEQHARMLQILTHHQLTKIEGEVEYNYTFEAKVKKLYVTDDIQKALVNGRLALCGLDDKTYVVTSETAEKVATINASVVLLKNDRIVEDNIDEDDPYADFQIPDDLMW